MHAILFFVMDLLNLFTLVCGVKYPAHTRLHND